MAGQDACISIAEAKKQMERICAHENHQGEHKSNPSHVDEVHKKVKHQGEHKNYKEMHKDSEY